MLFDKKKSKKYVSCYNKKDEQQYSGLLLQCCYGSLSLPAFAILLKNQTKDVEK